MVGDPRYKISFWNKEISIIIKPTPILVNNKIKRILKWHPKKNLKDIISDILLNKFNYKNN